MGTMQYQFEFLHCGDHLRSSLNSEIVEVFSAVEAVSWHSEFIINVDEIEFKHQRGYNKAFEIEFLKLDWEYHPRLSVNPRLIGDFRKNLVFVEIQFGNSATLYRDFYKFQYDLQNGLLSLAVLIVPTTPEEFFPTRLKSVHNMAEYRLALRYFTVLSISVPTLIIGLQPKKEFV